MEGGGEGVVAIIRGLRDAGLSVTLTNGESSSISASVYASNPYVPLSHQLRSVDNGTNARVPITNTMDRGCNSASAYLSSYQEAHCNKRPYSPQLLHSEFPAQKDPSRYDGNFKVGWEQTGSGEIPSSSYRAFGTDTYRSSFHHPYRGSMEYDRATEAFASSLRRYSRSPARSSSAELVEKLISYTLNKNNTNPKAAKSTVKEGIDTEKREFKDKNVQTYTRSRQKTNDNDNVKSGSTKRMRLHSPVKDSREKRYKDLPTSDTYDYLRPPTPRSPRAPHSPRLYSRAAEVRYLCGVSRCIRDTIRQIIANDQSNVCSQMQSRYLAHRKKCLAATSKQSGVQAKGSFMESKSTGTVENEPVEACLPTCPYIAPPCCYCKDGQTTPRYDPKQEFERLVSEKVAKWLITIPAYASMSAEDKQKRIGMIEELANNIAALKNDEDINAKARAEIEKCLENLPMWLPPTKAEQDDLKKVITDNLMNKLDKVFEGADKLDEEISKWVGDIRFRSRNSQGEVVDKEKISEMIAERLRPLIIERQDDDDYDELMKNEIVDILQDLPLDIYGNKLQFINNLADKLAQTIKNIPVNEIKPAVKIDEFDKKIKQLIKDIKFKKRDSLGQEVDKQMIADLFAERLKALALDRPDDDDEYFEALKNEITDILDDLPLEVVGIKDKFLEKLANKMADVIKRISVSAISIKPDQFDESIAKWMDGLKFKKKDSQGNIVDKHEIADMISDRLKSVAVDRPDDDEEYHEMLKKEIADLLDELPIETKGDKEEFVDKISNKLTNTIKKIPASNIRTKLDKFDQSIAQWMGGLKLKKRDSQGNKVDKNKIADLISERLKPLAIDRPDDDEEYHEMMKKEIADLLDELPIETEGDKEDFVDKMANKLTKTIKKIPAKNIRTTPDKFDQSIAQWMGGLKLKKRDSQGNKVDKTKIADIISERLKPLAIDRPDDDEEYHEMLINEIADMLNELPIEVTGDKEQFVNKLANKLTNTIKKIPANNIRTKPDKFDRSIAQWMGGLKLKKRDSQGNIVDKTKIADIISERLKPLAIDRPDDDEEYHEMLINEIANMLNELPIEVTGDKEQFVNKLANKLTNTIKKIPAKNIRTKPDKFDQSIAQWMGGLKLKKRDSQGNIVDKNKIADIISERLKPLAKDRPDDDEEYHEMLINEIADMLNELPIEVTGDKEQFVNKLANKLTNTIKKIPAKNIRTKPDKFDQSIVQWMGGLKLKKRDSQGNIIDKNKIADIISERLKPLAKDRPDDDEEYHEMLKKEIADLLDELPVETKGDKEEFVDKMANKLTKTIKKIPAKNIRTKPDKFDRSIAQWMGGLKLKKRDSQGNIVDKNKIADLVSERLKPLAIDRPDDDEEYHEMLNKEISDLLDELPIEITGDKEQFVDKLSNKLTNTIKKIPTSIIKVKPDRFDKAISQWIGNIKFKERDNQGNTVDKNKIAKMISERLKSIAIDRPSNDEEYQELLKKEVANILDDLPIEIDENKDQFIGKLASKLTDVIKKIPSSEINTNPKPTELDTKIIDWLKNIPELSSMANMKTRTDRDMVQKLGKKLNILQSQGLDEEKLQEEMNKEIMDWMQTRLDKEGGEIHTRTKSELAERLIGNLREFKVIERRDSAEDIESQRSTESMLRKKSTGFRRKSISMSKSPDNIKGVVREKVKETLSNFNISNLEEVENDITDLLQSRVLQGLDTKTTKKKLRDILKSTGLSKDDINELITRLTLQAIDLSSMFSDTDTTLPNEFTSGEKEIFETSAVEEITDFINDMASDMDPKERGRVKLFAQRLAQQLGDVISDPQKSVEEKSDVLNTEVSNFLKNFSVPEKYGPLLVDQLRNLAVSSTPQSSEPSLSFHPKRSSSMNESIDNLISTLENVIHDWIIALPVELGDKNLVRNIARDLANDLADRQKYLQSHPNIKQSDHERLEFLKYQIFRAMGKSVEAKEMALILNQTASLLAELKEMSGYIKEMKSDDLLQLDTLQFLEENLSTGISDWLKSLPMYQRRNSKDKRIQEGIVEDIVKDIKNIMISPHEETDIDVQILQTIKKQLERFPMDEEIESDKAYVEKMAAQLVDYLNNLQIFDNISARQTIHPIEYLISTINDWMSSIPIESSNFDPKEIDEMKMNFLDRLNRALKDSNREDDQIIKEEIKRFLETLPLTSSTLHDHKFIPKKVNELFNRILGTPYLSNQGRPTINRDLVSSAVQDWSERLPYSSAQSRKNMLDKVQNFASEVSNILKDAKVTAVDNYKSKLQQKTVDFLKKSPIQSKKTEDLINLADDLLATIKNKATDLGPKSAPKNAADTLYENVGTWCDDLPISQGNTPEEKERINTVKQNLASRLVNKIGELNMNPEIFNDDFLYEQLLQEEIDDLLSGLPPSPEIEKNLESIKDNLMGKIRVAKEKTKDEVAGQTYKQKLRDTISKTLNFDMTSTSEEAKIEFDELADNLADAFVDLQFIPDSEEQKAKYKSKIVDEIKKYCDDYLKHNPEAPMDSSKLNENLYNALKSIPPPKDEILRSEAEHIRLKDEINDWMKNLPLVYGSNFQPIQKNKMASILAKKLHDIEKEKEINPDVDYGDREYNEVAKIFKKLPLKPEKQGEMNSMIQNLIDKLKNTEKSRRISASMIRNSFELIEESGVPKPGVKIADESSADQHCPCYYKFKEKTVKCKKIPKCTLSTEDRAHLERIRMRTSYPSCRIHRVCSCKDASVNPLPIDTASQTEVCPNISNICPRLSPRISPCPAQSQQEVSPQVVIKEYLWDSANSKLLGPVYRLPCVDTETSNSSVPCIQRILRKSVSIQKSPCVMPPCPTKSPCPPVSPRPCISLKSPCTSTHQLPAPKPFINIPRTVIPSLPTNYVNRSVNTVPCEESPCFPPPCVEVPTCSIPRRPTCMTREVPCFKPSLSIPCSPNDTESDGPSRGFPRVTNLGSFDKPTRPGTNPCQRRRMWHEGLSDYNDCQDFRRRIHMPKPCVQGRDYGRCNNCTPRRAPKPPRNKRSSDNLRQCTKCCGIMCPHPTGLFFR